MLVLAYCLFTSGCVAHGCHAHGCDGISCVCHHGDADPPPPPTPIRPAAAATAECISLMSRLQPELL